MKPRGPIAFLAPPACFGAAPADGFNPTRRIALFADEPRFALANVARTSAFRAFAGA